MAPSEGELVEDEELLVSAVEGEIVPNEVGVETEDLLLEEVVVGVVDIPKDWDVGNIFDETLMRFESGETPVFRITEMGRLLVRKKEQVRENGELINATVMPRPVNWRRRNKVPV